MPLEAFDDDRLARDENLAGTPMAGSYTTWALRGAPSATHRRNVRVPDRNDRAGAETHAAR